MTMKNIIGYLLLALLIIGMTIGIICIFYFIGDFTLVNSILCTLGTYTAAALLTLIVFLIINLITD